MTTPKKWGQESDDHPKEMGQESDDHPKETAPKTGN